MFPTACDPEFVRRRYKRISLLLFGIAFAPSFANVAAHMSWLGSPRSALATHLGLALSALSLAAVAVIAVLTVRWENQLVAQLTECAGRLCPHCAYPLADRSGPTVCPECGTACDMEEVERSWREFRPRFRSVFARRGAR